MTIRPRPGYTGEHVRRLLQDARLGLANTRSGTPIDRLNAYITWSNQQVRMLGRALSPADRDALITTPRYWVLQALDPGAKGGVLASMVDLEIEEQIQTLETAERDLQRASVELASADLIIVPDTNVFLHHPLPFAEVPWSELVERGSVKVLLYIPILVVDEIDQAKLSTRKVRDGSSEPVRARAQSSLTALERFLASSEWFELSGGPPAVVGTVALEDPRHIRLPSPDDELIDVARAVKAVSGARVAFVSYDTGARLRARAAGMQASSPPGDPDEVQS